jgi:prohibitin 1
MVFIAFIAAAIVSAVVFIASLKQARPTRENLFPLKRAQDVRRAAGVAMIVFIAGAASQVMVVVPAGHVGVIDFFGKVSPVTLRSGINLKNPMAQVIKLSVKTQEIKELMAVPSREGLTVKLEVSALFHLDPANAAQVYESIGPEYIRIILEPQFRSVARGVTAMYDAQALYTSEREVLSQRITEGLAKLVEPRGVVIESTPLRQLTLPQTLTAAIEEKLKAEQESQRMAFVLTRESQEAERKRIEAQGVSDFQAIIAKGISEPLLRWKGIEATSQLANSQNAKIVVIGAGKDGMPLILGQ